MTYDVETLVIGAGVIGLAVARAAARGGREVLVLEANPGIGQETSSRNSEVIHAGIYYPPGSLMAETCVAGRRALYAYCGANGIPHARIGKLIVATTDTEADSLDAIAAHAQANGVEGLRRLTAGEARSLEPELVCTGALLSPQTGIIDSHAYMLALQAEAEAHGARVVMRTRVTALRVGGAGLEVDTAGEGALTLRAREVINAAGLAAPVLARAMEAMPASMVPPVFYAKGSYFTLAGRAPFRRLVYPVPVPGGLGIHLTLDLAGQARFGPDVEWVSGIDYTVDPGRAAGFYGAIRRYWPGLADGALQPGYSGIRPKTVGPGGGRQDFSLCGPRTHGIPGLIHLFGIESPGLTASLALADRVCQALG